MRCRLPWIAALAVLAACQGSSGGVTDVTTSTGDPNALRVIEAPLVCDGCTRLVFSIAGTGAEQVVEASFRLHEQPRTPQPADIQLRRITGDSGVVRQATAVFASGTTAGEYDLVLTMMAPSGATSGAVIERALLMKRTTAGPGGTPGGATGLLDLLVTVSGVDKDDAFYVRLQKAGNRVDVPVADGQQASVAVETGTWSARLFDLSPNCSITSADPIAATVSSTGRAQLSWSVTCNTAARVRVTTTTTGADLPWGYALVCNATNCATPYIQANDTQTFIVASGSASISLWNVPNHCQVAGDNPRTVTAVPGATVEMAFSVTCVAIGGDLRVSVHLQGHNLDDRFIVTNERTCDWYYGCDTLELLPGSTVVFRAGPGDWTLRLADIASNCSVAENPKVATTVVGGTVDVVFDVTCQ